MQFEDPPAPNHPSGPRTESSEEATTTKGLDLEEPPELGQEVTSFLRGSLETSEDEGNGMPLEPAVTEFSQWVLWRADKCKTPSWWAELLAVPEIGDHKRLAREVWASFQLLQQMRELGMKEANLQAPPAPPCLHRQKFMPPAESIYSCRDIREIPQEKAVAYARALQHWVEEIDLPAGGGPHLLAKSVKELREEVKCYLSFSNEEVFQGVALPMQRRMIRVQRPRLLTSPGHPVHQSWPRRGEVQSSWGGKKFCILPNQWWLLGRSPNHPRP